MGSPTEGRRGFVVLGGEIVWRGRRVSMERGRFRGPDGSEFDREYMVHPGAVGVIAVDDHGVVTLVRQYRAPMGTTVLEMPAGTCDVDGEPVEETARRELAEEVGLVAADLRLLAPLPVSPGVSNQVFTVFLATGLSECDTDREGPEERAMTVERVALADVIEMAADGELIDAPTLAAVALARRALRAREG
jgi:8-oxo-dGTP pyrophosphatase MutT (NUDIX family)